MRIVSKGPIIIFDGRCNLCERSVRFVLKRDHKKQFRFAAIQTPAGRELVEGFGVGPPLDSIVLVAGGVAYIKSTAALHIASRVSGLWPLLKILLITPRPVRDWLYDVVAKNRYRWFGEKQACFIPTPEMRRRLLS
jgi:predicted DCC family thiol-disulfide oxidoreductase YuxK